MKTKKSICVIGLGRFGASVVENLLAMNENYVIVIDANQNIITKYKDLVFEAYSLDAADLNSLKNLGIENVDTVIVSVSDNIEIIASLLELKIKNIIARANNKKHERVLKQIGVKLIIRPEEEAGTRTAIITKNSNYLDYSENIIELGNDFVVGYVEVKNPQIWNKKIKDLELIKRKISVILIKKNVKFLLPTGDSIIEKNDSLRIIGKISNVVESMDWFTAKNLEKKENKT